MKIASFQMDRLRRVTSRQNAIIKDLRRAFTHHELTRDGYCAIEGVKTIEEAIRGGLKIHAVVFSDSGAVRAERLLPQIKVKVETILVADDVFESAVSTETPQGVAALVSVSEFTLEDACHGSRSLAVAAAGIQDPGNLGTILRSAEAFGATGVVLGEKTVSRFHAKAVRASAGSLFRLPCVQAPLANAIHAMKDHGMRVIGASSHKGTSLDEADLTGALAITIGSEGEGLPREVLALMDELITIPHSPKVESLNAGVAASVILYEAARQRRFSSARQDKE